jgi:hypothetical protein
VLIKTFLRKQLRLKAHTVTNVEEAEKFMVVHIDRLGSRLVGRRARSVRRGCTAIVPRGVGAGAELHVEIAIRKVVSSPRPLVLC